MPKKKAVPCARNGCGNTTRNDNGYCHVHQSIPNHPSMTTRIPMRHVATPRVARSNTLTALNHCRDAVTRKDRMVQERDGVPVLVGNAITELDETVMWAQSNADIAHRSSVGYLSEAACRTGVANLIGVRRILAEEKTEMVDDLGNRYDMIDTFALAKIDQYLDEAVDSLNRAQASVF